MIKLGEGEKIIMVARKHWFILLIETVFLIFLVFLPLVIWLIIKSFSISEYVTIAGNTSFLFGMFTSVWLLFVWISFFVIWTDYYLDILIVTNKHLIDVEQKGLFSREVSTLRMERIQDITAEVHGFIPTLLNFGNLNIQTAGMQREFTVKGIPNPYKTKDKIRNQYEEIINRTREVI